MLPRHTGLKSESPGSRHELVLHKPPSPARADECATYGYFAASPQEAGATGLPQHPSIPNCPLIDFY